MSANGSSGTTKLSLPDVPKPAPVPVNASRFAINSLSLACAPAPGVPPSGSKSSSKPPPLRATISRCFSISPLSLLNSSERSISLVVSLRLSSSEFLRP